jgi:2',3'-cyclic-nucleotide 2'-phosphodiesterase (5'-nucleotidase family)
MLLTALMLAKLSAGADSTLLRLLAINDFHGALEPRVYGWSGGRPIGGAPALKAILDSAALQCHCTTLRFDAGDEMQGTLASNLVFGRSSIEVLSAIGLDAAALGNHDFDWGVDSLRARMREAHYPWLAANIYDSLTGKRPAWAVPWRLLEKGGLKIAVIGYITPSSKTIVKAENVAGLVFRKGAAAFRDALDSAKAAHANLTILIAHEGAFCDSLPCKGEIIDLARELDSTQVQFIVSGHTHSLVKTVVNGIPIVQARANGTAYGVADLIRRSDGSLTWKVNVETAWADQVTPDAGVEAIVARYRPRVAQLAQQVVATLRDSLPNRRGEYALGNLIADAQRTAVAGADFAMMNNGGIRRDLYPGPLSYNTLFELQPFGNSLLELWVTGAQLKDILEHALQSGKPGDHVSGLLVRYDSRRPAGDRVVELRKADGSAVKPDASYTLILTDYLQGGGDGFAMLRILPMHRTGKTDLDALVDYLKHLPQPIAAPATGRFTDVAQ